MSMSRNRRIALAGVAAAVIVAGAAYVLYRYVQPDEHQPPKIELAGVDPLVANAIERVRIEVDESPASAAAWGKFGMVLFAHDFHGEALNVFAEAERLDPADPRWPYYQGMILLHERPNEAIGALERAADRSPRDSTPRLHLAEVLLNQDRLDKAEAHFRHVLVVDPDHPRALLGIGLIAWRRGDLQASLDPLNRVADVPECRRAARNALASAHQQLGHAQESARLQNEVARLGKDRAWPDPLMAQVLELQTGTRARLGQVNSLLNDGQLREAMILIDRIVADDPDSELARLALGRALMQTRDYAAAEQVMGETTRRWPGSVDAHLMRGGALLMLGRYADAAEAYRRVIAINPAHALAHLNLARSLRKAGQLSAARSAMMDAIRNKPDLLPAYIELAEWLVEDGDRQAAAAQLRDATRIAPEDERIKKMLSDIGP